MSDSASILVVGTDLAQTRQCEQALVGAGYRVRVVTSIGEVTRVMENGGADAIVVCFEHVPVALVDQHGSTTPIVSMQPDPSKDPLEPSALVDAVRQRLSGNHTAGGLGFVKPPSNDLRGSVVSKLTSETVRIQEEERRKLSLELHDDIAQVLGNLVLMMDACLAIAPAGDERLRRYLGEARNTAKEGFRRVQRFSIDLRPPMLDDLGLAPTIVWYAERYTKDHGTPVNVNMPDRLPPLTGEQETALFRVMQQALQNIHQHAHAHEVEVAVEQEPGHLRLIVRDDGVGFDPEDVEEKLAEGTHLGMVGMRYRVELLKGTFDIVSGAGQGTAVIADIPVPT